MLAPSRRKPAMPRFAILVLAAAFAVPLVAHGATPAKDVPRKHAVAKKRPVSRHWHGYGFLPGYRPPEVVDREDRMLYWRRHPSFWYGWPGYYRGRWNAGGFGPCWTQTPIGNVWNCGR